MGLFSIGAPHPRITERARRDRSTDELIGLCRGVLADGNVSHQEAKFLLDWLERQRDFLDVYPFDKLYRRISEALLDGVFDPDEERDLLEVVLRTVGGESQAPESSSSLSTSLPFDDPLPQVVFPDSVFVVTGVFAFGSRKEVVEAIQDRGGIVKPSMSHKVRFLVVGEIGSRDWKHSSFGRKIEQAVDIRSEGGLLSLIPEQHWVHSLN